MKIETIVEYTQEEMEAKILAMLATELGPPPKGTRWQLAQEYTKDWVYKTVPLTAEELAAQEKAEAAQVKDLAVGLHELLQRDEERVAQDKVGPVPRPYTLGPMELPKALKDEQGSSLLFVRGGL